MGGLDSLELPSADQRLTHSVQPAAKAFAFADGQRIAHAVHETVRDIEIRPALLPLRMAPIPGISASVETQRSRRNFVDGLLAMSALGSVDRLAEHAATGDTRAGDRHGKRVGPVIAGAHGVDFGRAVEFAGQDRPAHQAVAGEAD